MKTNLHQWPTDELLVRLRNQELPDALETQEILLEIEYLEKRFHHGSDSVTGSSDAANNSLSNNEHEQRLAYCRAFLAPIRRLPSELLAEIHHHILRSVRDNSPRPKEQLAPTRALVVLSHICSFWRRSCFSTTTLWKDIRIPSLFRSAKDARLVEMHLRYSGSSPLDIQIHNFGASREADMDSARDILEGLISHRERWRKVLVIGINTWVELNSACLTVHTQTDGLHFPLLESLLLQDADHSSVNAFSSADLPRLQTMEVHGYNPSSFPFHQLTSLSLVLDRRASQLPRDFTDHLTNLEHLRLEGEFAYLPNEIDCTDFESTLPRLKSLVIEMCSEPFLTLLNTFRLPALLSIEIITRLQDWPQAEFMSLLTRSQRLSALTKLSLRWAHITDEQLLEILRLTESLEELKVVEGNMNTLSLSLFRAMSISSTAPNTPIIVPKLQHIFLHMWISEKDCPVGIEIVASRSAKSLSSNLDSPSCVPLKSFMLFLVLAYKLVEPPASLGKESLRALRESMEITVRVTARDAPVEENFL